MCTFFLNGVQFANVVSADEEGRRALTSRLDQNGKVMRDPSGRMLTDEFFGDVRIMADDYILDEVRKGEPPA